jgi:hypothetical protein
MTPFQKKRVKRRLTKKDLELIETHPHNLSKIRSQYKKISIANLFESLQSQMATKHK